MLIKEHEFCLAPKFSQIPRSLAVKLITGCRLLFVIEDMKTKDRNKNVAITLGWRQTNLEHSFFAFQKRQICHFQRSFFVPRYSSPKGESSLHSLHLILFIMDSSQTVFTESVSYNLSQIISEWRKCKSQTITRRRKLSPVLTVYFSPYGSSHPPSSIYHLPSFFRSSHHTILPHLVVWWFPISHPHERRWKSRGCEKRQYFNSSVMRTPGRERKL